MHPGEPFPPDTTWQDGEEFHRRSQPVYTGDTAQRRLFKRSGDMAHVRYSPSHPEPAYDDFRGGRGTARCRWLASEQGGQAEGISRSRLDGLLDTWLEPGASVGWHLHRDTEEVYYVLDGELEVHTEDEAGRTHVFPARPGDTTRVGPGMSHAARAGSDGARFLCVILRVDEDPSS